MLTTFLALIYIVYFLYELIDRIGRRVRGEGPKVCIVRPSVRCDPNSSSGRSSPEYYLNFRGERITFHNYNQSPSYSDDDSVGEEDAGEEFFMWRRHGGGGWTGWNSYDD